MAKHRFATDDEDPWIHDGVEGVEAEGCQVLIVVTRRMDGINKSCDLKGQKNTDVSGWCSSQMQCPFSLKYSSSALMKQLLSNEYGEAWHY